MCSPCQAAANQRKAAYAMCHVCRDRPTCAAFQKMTVGGVFILNEPCPRDRHPDARGLIRWARARWYGVPAPIRYRVALEAAWAAWRERTAAGYLPGCGCHYRLKNASLWFIRVVFPIKPMNTAWHRGRGRALGTYRSLRRHHRAVPAPSQRAIP